MRILDVGPWIAYPPERGRAVRTYNLLLELSAKHDVRQFGRAESAIPGRQRLFEEVPVTPMFRVVRCRYPLGYPVADWLVRRERTGGLREAAARRLVCPKRFQELLRWAQVIVAEDPVELALCRQEWPAGRYAFVAHDVGLPEAVSRSGHDRLAQAVATAELTIAVSPSDREELIARYGLAPERVAVVPNGADPERLRPLDAAAKRALRAELGLPPGPVVLFAGSSSPPNLVGLAWVRRLAKATDRFTFVVVGSVAKAEQSGRLRVMGPVRDVAAYFQAADLALCPIEHGSGTRMKLWASLAAGLPTVAFAESLRGTGLEAGRHVVVTEKSEPALLAALERLAHDPDLAARLTGAGRSFVVEHRSWRRSAELLAGALEQLLFADESGRPASGIAAA
jgi:glycosyltransferase involved in cell wall biosynthesis